MHRSHLYMSRSLSLSLSLSGSINGAISWTIKALNYAILHGAKITNNSWGGQG